MKTKQHVLVTGGAGYIGSIMCEQLLNSGYSVTVVDRLLYDQNALFHLCNHKEFEFINADVRDKMVMAPLVQRADVIIPLAAIVGAPACDRDITAAESVNFGAIQMINRLRSPSQLIVYPNTNSGYGATSGDLHCDENTPLEPISLYGKVKVQAEKEVLGTANAIVLRLATVFGMSPRFRVDLLVNNFVHAAFFDRYIVVFEKHFKRNYVHVRDVADCFIHCIEHASAMSGRPYNVGLDEANLSKEELALQVKKFVPDFYIHFSDIGTDVDKRNYIVSNARLREAGFCARRSIADGIQELLKGLAMIRRKPFTNL